MKFLKEGIKTMVAVMLEVVFGLTGSLVIFFLLIGVPYLSVKRYFEEREFYLDKSNRKIVLKESYHDKALRKKHKKKVKLHLKDLSKEKKRVTFNGGVYEQMRIGENIVYLKALLRKMEQKGDKNKQKY